MLSAIRAMSSRVAHDLAHMDTQRLGPESHAEQQDELLAAGARERTRGRQGGGGARARAARRAARGRGGGRRRVRPDRDRRRLPRGAARRRRRRSSSTSSRPAALHRPEHESSSFRYCTNFAVTGRGPRRARSFPELEALGRLGAGGGDERTLRVHVHTDDPERAVGAVRRRGRGVALRRGRHARAGGRPHARGSPGTRPSRRRHCASWRWPAGAGVRRLLRGARRAGGGRRRDDEPVHLRAARRDPRRQRPRGARAAQQPERDPGRRARRASCPRSRRAVVPTTRAAGGARRAARFDPDAGAEQNAAGRGRARARRCASGGVAPAARDDVQGRFVAGDAVGYAGGELVAWGDPGATLAATLEQHRRRHRAAHLPRRRRGAARSRATSRPTCPTGSRSSTTRAVNPPGGGCSARSNRLRASPSQRARPLGGAGRRAGQVVPRVRAPLRRAGGAGRNGARKALETLGIETVGDLLEHLPHSHATGATCAGRRPDGGRGGDRRRDGALGDRRGRCATAAASASRRGWPTRPARWWPCGSTSPGSRASSPRARTCCFTAGCAARASSGCPSTSRSGTGRAVHTVGLVPVHPATEGLSAGRSARARVGARAPLPAHALEPLPGGPARGRAAAGARRRARRRALPRQRGRRAGARRRLAFEELLLLQLAVAGPPARAPRGPQRAAARRPRRGGGPLAVVAAVRAHGRPEERHERDRRGPRRASGRCSAC